jgi:hypothetical protein
LGIDNEAGVGTKLRRFSPTIVGDGLAPAWTAYTPTLSASSGTLTSASATGFYLKIGKKVSVQMTITIVTNGTAAAILRASLPFAANRSFVLAGRENAIAGKMIQALTSAASSTLNIFNYDNTYPGSSGASIIISGVYEST